MMTEKMNDLIKNLNSELAIKGSIHVLECIKFDFKVLLVIDPINRLFIEIEENVVTIFYSDEHDEFWLKPYKNEETLINDVVKFIKLLLLNTVLIKYVHSENTLLSYKIWAISKESKEKRLLKKVTVSINPFLRIKAKSTSSKEIHFKNQKQN